jgi:hypothetical protein
MMHSKQAPEKTIIVLHVSIGRNTQEEELSEPVEDMEKLELCQLDCQICLLSPEINRKPLGGQQIKLWMEFIFN